MDYAETLARGATIGDLDVGEFRRFRRLCASGKGDRVLAELADEEILRSLRLVLPAYDNALTLGAVMLFGTPESVVRYVPTAEVIFQEFRGDSVAANDTPSWIPHSKPHADTSGSAMRRAWTSSTNSKHGKTIPSNGTYLRGQRRPTAARLPAKFGSRRQHGHETLPTLAGSLVRRDT